MDKGTKDIKTLLKKVIEILMPNLDHYRRPLRKGKVAATYPSDGKYVCDVQILLNNEQPDEAEPLVKGVEIPVIWGGQNRGIICPPAVGVLCDVDYYHGNPDYPRISNFRWQGSGAPQAAIDELIIQQKDGVFIRITSENDVEITSTGNLNITMNGKGAVLCKEGISLDGGSGNVTGVVTMECICAFTGKPHSDYSSNLKGSR